MFPGSYSEICGRGDRLGCILNLGAHFTPSRQIWELAGGLADLPGAESLRNSLSASYRESGVTAATPVGVVDDAVVLQGREPQ